MDKPAAFESVLDRAIRLAGSQTKLAEIVGRSQPTVSLWVKNGMKLPAECVRAVEAALGIPRHELRPDLYDPPEERVPAPQPTAQHPAAHPSASALPPQAPGAGVDGSSPALDYPGKPAPAQAGDPLEGMAT